MTDKIKALIETRVRRYVYTLPDNEGQELLTRAATEKRAELTAFAEQVQRIVWEEGNQVGDELPVVE